MRRGGTTQLGRFPLPRPSHHRFFIRLRLYPVAISARRRNGVSVRGRGGECTRLGKCRVENLELCILPSAPSPRLSSSRLHLILSIPLPRRPTIFRCRSRRFSRTRVPLPLPRPPPLSFPSVSLSFRSKGVKLYRLKIRQTVRLNPS